MTTTTKTEIVNTEDALQELVAYLRTQKVFAFDTETTSLHCLKARMVILSLATKDRAFAIPTGMPWGVNLSNLKVVEAMDEFFLDTKYLKVAHNAKYDMHVLMNYELPVNNYFCTMAAAHMLDENRLVGLKERAKDVGMTMDTYYEIAKSCGAKKVNSKSGFVECVLASGEANQHKFLDYAGDDAVATMRLFRKYRAEMKKDNIEGAFKHQENPMAKVLMKMERRGVLIDRKALDKVGDHVTEALSWAKQELYDISGMQFNPSSSPQIADILYNHLGIEPFRFTKGGKSGVVKPSTDATTLKILANQGVKFAQELLEYRKLDKMNSSYTSPDSSLRSSVMPSGRVHTNLNNAATTTGRLSSSSPNLQQIPARKDAIPLRTVFVAPKGHILICCDYSQMELRMIAHVTQDENMMAAYADYGDLHQKTMDLLNCSRSLAKPVNFGLAYGTSVDTLATLLEVPTEEAAIYHKGFFDAYPGINRFKSIILEHARQAKEITLISGRKRRLPDICSRDRKKRSYAERQCFNTYIQGGCADIMKQGLLNLDRSEAMMDYHARLLLTVHDEVLVECPEKYAWPVVRVVKDALENHPFDLSLPFLTEAEIGFSWGTAKP